MNIAIYGKNFNKNFNEYIHQLFKKFHQHNVNIIIFKPFYDFLVEQVKFQPKINGVFTSDTDINKDIDFLFSIGGDGTFLETISFIRNSGIPIVGINSGRLGFLANISKEEISKAINDIFNDKYSFVERTLIKLETPNNLFGDFNYALNELTVLKKDTSSMITIHTYMNNEFLNTFWADGLIISTPTGSTAYSLSVGGPILIPGSENFLITPIAPHNLTVRPIVVPDKNKITIKVEGREKNYLASLDYRSEVFDSSIELQVMKADFKIKILNLHNHSYFNTLRNKLMWGVDKRN